jgi:hypothetical protein
MMQVRAYIVGKRYFYDSSYRPQLFV